MQLVWKSTSGLLFAFSSSSLGDGNDETIAVENNENNKGCLQLNKERVESSDAFDI